MLIKRSVLHYILAYVLWVISTGLGIYVFIKGRDTIMLATVVSSSTGEPTKSEQFYASLRAAAIDNWSILFIGLLILILLVGIENYYRMSVPPGKLMRRFFLVTGIEFAVLFVVHTIYFVLLQTFRTLGWTAVAMPAGELVLAVFFLWVYSILRKKPAVAVSP